MPEVTLQSEKVSELGKLLFESDASLMQERIHVMAMQCPEVVCAYSEPIKLYTEVGWWSRLEQPN